MNDIKTVTNIDALQIINDANRELLVRINNFLNNEIQSIQNEIIFEMALKELFVQYVWVEQHPEHFLNCYVTSSEYGENNSTGYSWYLSVMNGRFNHEFYKTTGYDLCTDRKETIQRMRNLLVEALTCQNIISWCTEHFKI